MKKQNKILNLTNDNWKAEKQWQKVGLKIHKIPLTKTQKIANTVAAVNVIIPLTAWPVTSPIIIKVGTMMSRNSKVRVLR